MRKSKNPQSPWHLHVVIQQRTQIKASVSLINIQIHQKPGSGWLFVSPHRSKGFPRNPLSLSLSVPGQTR